MKGTTLRLVGQWLRLCTEHTYIHTHTHTHTHTRTKGASRGWGGCYLQTIYKGVSRFYSVSGGKIAAENDQAILRD